MERRQLSIPDWQDNRNPAGIRGDAFAGRFQPLDEGICICWNRLIHYQALRWAMRFLSRLGDGVFWYALMAAMLALGEDAVRPVAQMVATGLFACMVYKALKHGTLRPRPYQVLACITPGAAPLDHFSFPSGHTLHAVAFTVIACHHYPSLYFALAPFTLLTAVSRIALGLHYPSDVLIGASLGGMLAMTSFFVF